MDCLLLLNINYSSLSGDLPSYNANIVLENISKYIDGKELEIIIINDQHGKYDNEFKYYPPHSIRNTYDCLWQYIDKIRNGKQITILGKNTFSALKKEHNKKLILGKYDNILVGGFAGVDVLATYLDLIAYGENVKVEENLVGDINEEVLKMNLTYMRFLNPLKE